MAAKYVSIRLRINLIIPALVVLVEEVDTTLEPVAANKVIKEEEEVVVVMVSSLMSLILNHNANNVYLAVNPYAQRNQGMRRISC
jgi:hypothetical protein